MKWLQNPNIEIDRLGWTRRIDVHTIRRGRVWNANGESGEKQLDVFGLASGCPPFAMGRQLQI